MMRHRRTPIALLVLALVAAVGLAACGDDEDPAVGADTDDTTADAAADTTAGDEGDDADDAGGGEAVELKVDDSGGSTEVAVGDTIVVTLPVGGGTGYSWQLNGHEFTGVLELIDETQGRVDPVEEGDDPVVGAPEQQVFTFEAVGEGEAQIAISLYAPANQDEPEEDFTYDVTITG